MPKTEGKTKKRNFTDCEVEVLVDEVEQRRAVLFGGHSTGVTNAKKTCEWQHVADAVNSVASQGRTMAEVKEKRSNIKVDAKKRIAAHRQSVRAAGGGKGEPELTPLDRKLAGILGETLLSGVEREEEGDTDAGPHEPAQDSVAGCASEASSVSAAAAEVPRTSTASDACASMPKPATSARVLTDSVLQVQREHVDAVREIARELKEINELSALNSSIKEFLKK
ncbi:uncharacterized protein LOC132889793 [Neoarius graeffei]|uniref:uncharacterized protein LOC132889793 n=1 Tax=Neoarius graeffei TaxID=443677 RepID=UPI00298BE9AA|nr:uncharacterized protein LOC132889793 [Neoarius graeffei]